jgi:hypothetical protein
VIFWAGRTIYIRYFCRNRRRRHFSMFHLMTGTDSVRKCYYHAVWIDWQWYFKFLLQPKEGLLYAKNPVVLIVTIISNSHRQNVVSQSKWHNFINMYVFVELIFGLRMTIIWRKHERTLRINLNTNTAVLTVINTN